VGVKVLRVEGLSEVEELFLETVTRFVDDEVMPVAHDLERADTYPEDLIEKMKALGLFGLAVPEPYGPGRVSACAFALIGEELARGWMSLSGSIGSHSVVSHLIDVFGTDEQKDRYLPRMATGEVRAAMALTEPGGGSDLQAILTVARHSDDGYCINGSKTWITNAQHASLIAILCKTDPKADPPHKGISIILAEKGPGFTVSRNLSKLGYRGIESCELAFEDFMVPTDALLGRVEGEGFRQMMTGLELGRIQVAARAVGVARAAFEASLLYAQQREAFGKPIWRHQAIGGYLADMATKLQAARLMMLHAARTFDDGRRSDLEAGMAKLFASAAAHQITVDAMRIHGSYGYSTELDIERYYRDAPLMIIGEGTNEIQRNVIARQLVDRGRLF
jgi:alkylation response protein AidB-like acyl-CoA dehydrogenase